MMEFIEAPARLFDILLPGRAIGRGAINEVNSALLITDCRLYECVVVPWIVKMLPRKIGMRQWQIRSTGDYLNFAAVVRWPTYTFILLRMQKCTRTARSLRNAE